MSKQYPYFISLDEAVSICNEYQIKLSTETISISNALSRVLATSVIAKVDDPGFDNSSMDGFAVLHADTVKAPAKLTIVGVSNAGTKEQPRIEKGEALRIMTGGPMPSGADSIIPIELCTIEGDEVILQEPSKPNYVRKKGENFTQQQELFPAGTIMSPEKISLCAAAGISEIIVYKKLKIAVISTGDELKNLGGELTFGQIYESNSYGLKSLIEMYGHEATRFPYVIDDIKVLREALDDAAKNFDCIITSGGVSYDREKVAAHAQNLANRVKGNLEGSLTALGVTVFPNKGVVIPDLKCRKLTHCPMEQGRRQMGGRHESGHLGQPSCELCEHLPFLAPDLGIWDNAHLAFNSCVAALLCKL